ncbi:hypothetical protein ACT8ZV_23045 [Nocardioides sp. MAHUQ-72]|uniref:hypothetical protein n=1 Tax=unclassified Nocardioides TaxID=2615069 RepID=UPI003622C86A
MTTPTQPNFDRAFRLAAGDLRPTGDRDFDDPTTREPGRIDKRVLLQDTCWYDIRAQRHQLDAMSPDYRANVLAHLEQQSPTWLHEATVWIYLDCLRGDISTAEAAERLELLDLLTPGWTGHTPLGRRLHQLNGTTPDELERPPTPLGPDQTDRREILRDTDHDSWQITTESTTTYLIDLDRRRVARRPGVGTGNGHGSGPAAPFHVKMLPFDREWTDLTGLVQCRLGRSLFILDERPTGSGYRLSTPVTQIEPGARPTSPPRGSCGGT